MSKVVRVAERGELPQRGRRVLVYVPGKREGWYIGHRKNDGRWSIELHFVEDTEPTHWTPLPGEPNGE